MQCIFTSNDYLPPASIFGKLTMDMPDIGDSNYIQKHFKYAINIGQDGRIIIITF